MSAVLPAWGAAGVVTSPRGPASPWPVPAAQQLPYLYWLAGPRKRFLLVQPDDAVEALLQQLDRPQQQEAA